MNYFRAHCTAASSHTDWGLGSFIVTEWPHLCSLTREVYPPPGLKRRGEAETGNKRNSGVFFFNSNFRLSDTQTSLKAEWMDQNEREKFKIRCVHF